jgi:hypothetical protein
VIAQIRKPIPPEVYARHEEGRKHLSKLFKTEKAPWEK